MHRRGAGRSTQSDLKAYGQNRSHRICSGIIDVTPICAHARSPPQAETTSRLVKYL
jgi:hypothetical protein